MKKGHKCYPAYLLLQAVRLGFIEKAEVGLPVIGNSLNKIWIHLLIFHGVTALGFLYQNTQFLQSSHEHAFACLWFSFANCKNFNYYNISEISLSYQRKDFFVQESNSLQNVSCFVFHMRKKMFHWETAQSI